MDLSITQVPTWISLLFIVSFMSVPVFLIAHAAKSGAEKAGYDNPVLLRNKVILFFWMYFVLVGLVSLTGFLEKNTLPPRIIICTSIPLFLFYVFYVQRSSWFKNIFSKVTLEQLILIHTFRFVGVFFLLLYGYESLPKEFAFIGGGGDIITALLVFPLLYTLRKKAKWSKFLVMVWNVIGLLDIFSVLTSAVIITRLAVANNEAGVQQFGTFPFSWIPAFAPPTIIFLHLLIFKKINQTFLR